MLEFIEELKEARIYKGESTLENKTAEDIAKASFLCIMMLEILRHSDKEYARDYAKSTIAYENFEVLRMNTTDLQNMLAILNNQDKHAKRIKTDPNIAVPVLQIKRYMRDIANGNKDPNLDRQLFMTLERFFKISSGDYKNIRREVGDWKLAHKSDRTTVTKNINTFINRLQNIQPDIAVYFAKHQD